MFVAICLLGLMMLGASYAVVYSSFWLIASLTATQFSLFGTTLIWVILMVALLWRMWYETFNDGFSNGKRGTR